MIPNNDSEIEYIDNIEPQGFEITREEVEYLVNNIQNEFLNRDTYWLAVNLIKRMRKYLENDVA